MKRLFAIISLFIAYSAVSYAQERTYSFNFSTEVMSHYLWRGQKLANLSIMPDASFEYTKGNAGFYAGVYTLQEFIYWLDSKNRYTETGLYLGFNYENFTFEVNDYLGDVLDLGFIYQYSEDYPLTLSWNVIPAGAFFRALDMKSDFSSYIEASYPFEVSEFTITPSIGAIPFKSEYYGNYENKFSFYNLSLTAEYLFNLRNEYELPLSAQLTYNPLFREMYWRVSAKINFNFER